MKSNLRTFWVFQCDSDVCSLPGSWHSSSHCSLEFGGISERSSHYDSPHFTVREPERKSPGYRWCCFQFRFEKLER